ncbi:potassium/sodium hyperpolarization-activated cyclic nucleotide-gated channel 1-like [Zeugodacus cucurbitae]|nr:potassium/sodium hyperpolarization-activated cyclic nucleotide-gated channel 1-like [Zeugodacus cucurbitae]
MSTTIQPSANMDLDTSTQAENNSNNNQQNNTNALSINASVIQVGGGSSSIVANGICACDPTQSQQACPILITSAQQQLQADEQSEHHEQQQQQQEQQQQSYQLQDIPATDSGRASVNEFDTTTTMLEDTLPATIVALTTTSDTANVANVASFKDDVAAIPATIVTVGAGNSQDFYASSGSQTKWYLRPTEICGADVSCSVAPSPPPPPCVAVNNVVIISTSGSTEVDEFVSQATTVGGIVKCTAGVEG